MQDAYAGGKRVFSRFAGPLAFTAHFSGEPINKPAPLPKRFHPQLWPIKLVWYVRLRIHKTVPA